MAFLDIVNIPRLLGTDLHCFKRVNVWDKLDLGLATALAVVGSVCFYQIFLENEEIYLKDRVSAHRVLQSSGLRPHRLPELGDQHQLRAGLDLPEQHLQHRVPVSTRRALPLSPAGSGSLHDWSSHCSYLLGKLCYQGLQCHSSYMTV